MKLSKNKKIMTLTFIILFLLVSSGIFLLSLYSSPNSVLYSSHNTSENLLTSLTANSSANIRYSIFSFIAQRRIDDFKQIFSHNNSTSLILNKVYAADTTDLSKQELLIQISNEYRNSILKQTDIFSINKNPDKILGTLGNYENQLLDFKSLDKDSYANVILLKLIDKTISLEQDQIVGKGDAITDNIIIINEKRIVLLFDEYYKLSDRVKNLKDKVKQEKLNFLLKLILQNIQDSETNYDLQNFNESYSNASIALNYIQEIKNNIIPINITPSLQTQLTNQDIKEIKQKISFLSDNSINVANTQIILKSAEDSINKRNLSEADNLIRQAEMDLQSKTLVHEENEVKQPEDITTNQDSKIINKLENETEITNNDILPVTLNNFSSSSDSSNSSISTSSLDSDNNSSTSASSLNLDNNSSSSESSEASSQPQNTSSVSDIDNSVNINPSSEQKINSTEDSSVQNKLDDLLNQPF